MDLPCGCQPRSAGASCCDDHACDRPALLCDGDIVGGTSINFYLDSYDAIVAFARNEDPDAPEYESPASFFHAATEDVLAPLSFRFEPVMSSGSDSAASGADATPSLNDNSIPTAAVFNVQAPRAQVVDLTAETPAATLRDGNAQHSDAGHSHTLTTSATVDLTATTHAGSNVVGLSMNDLTMADGEVHWSLPNAQHNTDSSYHRNEIRPSIPHTPPGNDDYMPDGSWNFHQARLALAEHDFSGLDFNPENDLPFSQVQEPPTGDIFAYASLEFQDGTFYMNSLNVTLGRDSGAFKSLQRQLENGERLVEGTELGLDSQDMPQTPLFQRQLQAPNSVVSHSGGFLRLGKVKKSAKSRKRSMSSQDSLSDTTGQQTMLDADNTIMEDAEDEVPAPVVVDELVQDKWRCEHVYIHPPIDRGLQGYKCISRKHVRIMYDTTRGQWTAHVLGNNGMFINEIHRARGTELRVRHGDVLQIAGISFKFILPNGHEDESVETEYDEDQSGVQYAFQDERSKVAVQDTESPTSVRSRSLITPQDSNDDSAEPQAILQASTDNRASKSRSKSQDKVTGQNESDEEDDGEDQNELMGNGSVGRSSMSIEPLSFDPLRLPIPEKRRGPGRPPKNGIMSKKKERELLREQQERAMQSADVGSENAIKNKVGRPRKYPRPEGEDDTPREKRPYKKREKKEPGAEGDDSKKDVRSRTERSPTPTFNEADLTPEQLMKPTANYVQLIFEALQEKGAPMGLPAIYRAIQRKYPYFVVKVDTVGWQSSVRHNLSQHDAFKKVDKEGKGWTWGLVDGATIEKFDKQKKARTPPPPGPAGTYPQPFPPFNGAPPPGYQADGFQALQYPSGQGQPYPPQPYPSSQGPAYSAGSQRPYNAKAPAGPRATHGAYTAPPGPPGPPPMPDHLTKAIATFRNAIVDELKLRSELNADLITKSAIDRVLGWSFTSAVPRNIYEDRIMEALRPVVLQASSVPARAPVAMPPPPRRTSAVAKAVNTASPVANSGPGPAQPGMNGPVPFGAAVSHHGTTPSPRPMANNAARPPMPPINAPRPIQGIPTAHPYPTAPPPGPMTGMLVLNTPQHSGPTGTMPQQHLRPEPPRVLSSPSTTVPQPVKDNSPASMFKMSFDHEAAKAKLFARAEAELNANGKRALSVVNGMTGDQPDAKRMQVASGPAIARVNALGVANSPNGVATTIAMNVSNDMNTNGKRQLNGGNSANGVSAVVQPEAKRLQLTNEPVNVRVDGLGLSSVTSGTTATNETNVGNETNTNGTRRSDAPNSAHGGGSAGQLDVKRPVNGS